MLVLNNEDLNQVTWEQRVMEGDPKFEASQDDPQVRFDAFARLIGLEGIRVDRSADIEAAVREAFAADRPVIIDALTDPEEPPLPPHITFEQARELRRVDPRRTPPAASPAPSRRCARRSTSSCRAAEMRLRRAPAPPRTARAEHLIDRWRREHRARPLRALARPASPRSPRR